MKASVFERFLKFVLIGSFFAICFSCSSSSEKPASGDAPARIELPSGEDNPLGKQVYVAKCKLCHGVNGQMGGSGAANLAISLLTQEEAEEVITNGRRLMRAFSQELSEEEIEAVARYIQAFKD